MIFIIGVLSIQLKLITHAVDGQLNPLTLLYVRRVIRQTRPRKTAGLRDVIILLWSLLYCIDLLI
jgi:hypothetical protein